MRYNKIVSLLLFVLLLGVGKNTFSMNTFSMLKFLSYISCGRIAPYTSNLTNQASQLTDSNEQFKKINEVRLDRLSVSNKCYAKTISAYGNYVVTKYINRWSKDKKMIAVWDISKKKPKEIFFHKHDGFINKIALRQDGRYITWGAKNEVIVYDIKNNKEIYSYKHTNKVKCVCLFQNGNCVASGSHDGEVKVCDIINNKKLCSYKHNYGVNFVCFSPSGRYVASSSYDGEIKVCDVHQKEEKIYSYNHKSFVCCICFSQDGNSVASGSDNGKVIVYNIKNNEIGSYKHEGWVRSVSFSPCGRYVASVSKNGKVIVYDIKIYKQMSYPTTDGEKFSCVCFSQDGNCIALGSENKKVVVLDIKNNEVIYSCKHHVDEITCVYFSQDSKRLIFIDYCGKVIIHRVSLEFYLNQKQYKNRKKCAEYAKIEKLDKKERAEFVQKGSDCSIRFTDGEKLYVSKCFLTN